MKVPNHFIDLIIFDKNIVLIFVICSFSKLLGTPSTIYYYIGSV